MSLEFEADADVPQPARAVERTRKNKAIVREYLTEGLFGGDESVLAASVADDHVQYGPALYQEYVGVDECLAYADGLRAAFPDLAVSVSEMMAIGDHVLANGRLQGRQTGELVLGDAVFPPTDRGATWRVTVQCRIADGKVAETRLGMNKTSLMRQLGISFARSAPVDAAEL